MIDAGNPTRRQGKHSDANYIREAQGGDTVYFMDYTGQPGFPEQVAKSAGKVIVLDHHKTAHESLCGRDDLPDNLEINIDMNRSGATIARDYFGSVKVYL
jgi:nanoRNase/pAp phosphatase (c-di-AMP/oligoRNAs hydrolase)